MSTYWSARHTPSSGDKLVPILEQLGPAGLMACSGPLKAAANANVNLASFWKLSDWCDDACQRVVMHCNGDTNLLIEA